MKIGMITSSYPRFEGDIAGTFVRSLAESISALGHEVHVLAPYDTAVKELHGPVHVHRFRYFVGRRWYLVGYAKSLESDVSLRKIVYLLLPFYTIAAFRALCRLQHLVALDIIHAHWVVPSGPIAALVARYTHTPLVISLHGSDVFMLERNILARWAAHWAFSQADRVTACSSDLLERAQKHGLSPHKAQLIPYGVAHDRFQDDPDSSRVLREQLGIAVDAPVVLALGRLVYKKGFEYLVRAMPDLVKRFSNVRVVIAGEGPLRENLLRLAQELGVQDHLLLVNSVPWTDTPRYLNLCDVFVVPSVHDHKGNVDGLPNVLLEAMSCGKPIVATQVAGIPEVIVDRQNGLLVEEKDPHQLALAITKLLVSPELAQQYGMACRTKIEQDLTWRLIAQRMVEVYEQAIAASK
ncbi:MAG: glycosyltransferase [Chloroflexi bacterium]|nr:glycosyltransferase [Chloroflexota bacterium]